MNDQADDHLTLYEPALDVAEACADSFLTAIALTLQLSGRPDDDENIKLLATALVDHVIARSKIEGPKPGSFAEGA